MSEFEDFAKRIKEEEYAWEKLTKEQKELIRHVRVSLGEPLVMVEIANENILAAYYQAQEWCSLVLRDDEKGLTARGIWVKKMTLALSQKMLGLVRSKYTDIPVPGKDNPLHLGTGGVALIKDASNQIKYLLNLLEDIL